jgi:lipopolysaccharide/colanic/teichoic acid biosynthesis glycosyltransferase
MNNNRLVFVRWSLLFSYLAIFYASLLLTIRLRYGEWIGGAYLAEHLSAFTIVYLIWLPLFYIHHLFEPSLFRRWWTLVFSLASAMTLCLFAAISYFYFQPGLILTPRRFLLLHIAITTVLILLWQLFVKYLINHHLIEDLYLFSSEEDENLQGEIRNYQYLGVRYAGLIKPDDLANLRFDRPMSLIISATGTLSPEAIQKLYSLRVYNVTFYNMMTLHESLGRKIILEELNEQWFITNVNYRKKLFYEVLKRGIDLMAGLIGFVVFALTYPVIGLLIKLTSPGPVIFKQPRVGKYGTIITVYKYRTMAGSVHDTWTQVNDSRVTGMGKFLRRTRLDELPQCMNLLQGNMSLVGPRPEQPRIVENLRREIPFYDERHLVKPGITGWGQLNVYARSVEESKIKLQYDLYYIKHRSLWFDIEIILKTLYHVLISNNG